MDNNKKVLAGKPFKCVFTRENSVINYVSWRIALAIVLVHFMRSLMFPVSSKCFSFSLSLSPLRYFSLDFLFFLCPLNYPVAINFCLNMTWPRSLDFFILTSFAIFRCSETSLGAFFVLEQWFPINQGLRTPVLFQNPGHGPLYFGKFSYIYIW